jgi:hypothetical protein
MESVDIIQHKVEARTPCMDARMRRRWAAAEATALGRGGVTAGSAATGMARTTIARGVREPQGGTPEEGPSPRLRRPGGGRQPVVRPEATVRRALAALGDPVTRGDPPAPWRWTGQRTRRVAVALRAMRHAVGARTVAQRLQGVHDTVQAKRTTKEGPSPPDRPTPFDHLTARTTALQGQGQPVIAVDTQPKAWGGDGTQGGQEWQPMGQPEPGWGDDFPD